MVTAQTSVLSDLRSSQVQSQPRRGHIRLLYSNLVQLLSDCFWSRRVSSAGAFVTSSFLLL